MTTNPITIPKSGVLSSDVTIALPDSVQNMSRYRLFVSDCSVTSLGAFEHPIAFEQL